MSIRTRRHPNERLLVLAGLGLASLLCVGLAAAREVRYLGRVLRWNSWDLLVRPGRRLGELAPGLTHVPALAHAAAISLALTILLAATYLAFYALVGIRLDPDRRR